MYLSTCIGMTAHCNCTFDGSELRMCDCFQVAEQLFRPLVFQMIHWFTRNTQYESPDTITLLEAILVGYIAVDFAVITI